MFLLGMAHHVPELDRLDGEELALVEEREVSSELSGREVPQSNAAPGAAGEMMVVRLVLVLVLLLLELEHIGIVFGVGVVIVAREGAGAGVLERVLAVEVGVLAAGVARRQERRHHGPLYRHRWRQDADGRRERWQRGKRRRWEALGSGRR